MTDYLMSYDVLKEGETRICGRYISWSNAATDPAVKQYWVEKSLELSREVKQTDPKDLDAVKAKLDDLTDLFQSLPSEAPDVEL